MKIIFLGAPGAGKGTQADIVSRELNIPTISTGNMLRAAIREGTPVGLQAKDVIAKGQLVNDEIIMKIVEERVAKEDCANGYILDGVPRTIRQAEMLDEMGINIDKAISLEVDDAVIEERMTGRRTCEKCSETYHVTANPPKVEGVCNKCGGKLVIRKDDQPETVKERLRVYHAETEPLLGYYEKAGKLVKIPYAGSIDATTKLIFDALRV